MKQLFAFKGPMTTVYLGETQTPVTLLRVPELLVTEVKEGSAGEKNQLQVSFGENSAHPPKTLSGKFKGLPRVPKYSKTITPPEGKELKRGDVLVLEDLVERGDVLNIRGISKGKGFTGTIKRWNFSRQPVSHGQSDRTRAPGSIGLGTTIGRIFKGKHMSGRSGGVAVTAINSKVVSVDKNKGEIFVTGGVPGNVGSLLTLTVKSHTDKLPEILNESHKSETIGVEPTQTDKPEAVETGEVSLDTASETTQNQSGAGEQ